MQHKRWKKRIFSGPVCEQIVWTSSTRTGSGRPPRPRFRTEQEREAHRMQIARRHCAALANCNFTTDGYFVTLTFDDENEVETVADAKRERDNFRRRLAYRCPDVKYMLFMGRGKSTNRIHFHMIVENVTPEDLEKAWNH